MTKESMIDRLREKGLKITPQRLAVIEVFVEKGHLHPGAHLIYEEGRKKKKGLSLSTVYATLNEFSRHGLIKTLEFDKLENRYEGSFDEHINLVCEGCGKIADYQASAAVDLKKVARETGFLAKGARMEYYGYCRDCLGKLGSGGRKDS